MEVRSIRKQGEEGYVLHLPLLVSQEPACQPPELTTGAVPSRFVMVGNRVPEIPAHTGKMLPRKAVQGCSWKGAENDHGMLVEYGG